MSKIIAIAQREIQERAFVLAVAVGAAAVPFLLPLMPWERGMLSAHMGQVRLVADVITVGYVLTLAVLLGASIVGRELQEKRLSFYFARPVSGSAIWYGKLIASLFLLAASAVIVSLPATLLIRSADPGEWWTLSAPALIGSVMAIGFLLLLLIHAASMMLRSRSPLIALDFVAAVIFIAVTLWLLTGMAAHQAQRLFVVLLVAVLVFVTLVLFFAGAWQLARGRIDLKRSHRELSLFTWSGLVVCVIVLAAATAWVASAGVADLAGKYAVQSTDGRALLIEGQAAHRFDYRAHFVTDVASGTTTSIGALFASKIVTSGDGSKAAWVEPDSMTMLRLMSGGSGQRLAFRLMTMPLGRRGEPTDAGIEIEGRVDGLELSRDGSRVALMSGGIISVFDIASRKSVGSARIPVDHAWSAEMQFIAPDDLRIFVREGDGKSNVRLSGYDYALGRRALRPLLDVVAPVAWTQYAPSADGRRLLARVNRGGKPGQPSLLTAVVYDLTEGKQLFEIAPQGGRVIGCSLLADGKLAVLGGGFVALGQSTPVTLNVYDEKGSVVRAVDLGQATRARIEAEIEPGVLAIATSTSSSSKRGEVRWVVDRIDVNSGSRSRIADDLAPVWQFPYGVAAAQPSPQTTRVYSDANGEHYFAVDLKTGARRTLL